MCWELLKKNRNWALMISGFFLATAVSNLALAALNQTISFFGMTIDRNIYLLRFAIHGVLGYLFLKYWEKAQPRNKKRR